MRLSTKRSQIRHAESRVNALQHPTGHLRCLVLIGDEFARFVICQTQALANAFYMSCSPHRPRKAWHSLRRKGSKRNPNIQISC